MLESHGKIRMIVVNDTGPPPDNFKNLTIPRKDMTEVTQSRYRVYVSAREFVLVTAENAQHAILASGVKDPVRVLRYNPTDCNVLEFPLGGMPEQTRTAAPQAPEALQSHAVQPDNEAENLTKDD